MRSVSHWVKKRTNVSLNFLHNLAQAPDIFQRYIKQCVLCINTFQFAAFPFTARACSYYERNQEKDGVVRDRGRE